MTATEPQQLTLWPDDALPGQLPLFNRRGAVGVLAEFLPNRKTLSVSNPPAAEPIWEPDDWYDQRPPMEFVRAASVYL